MFRFRFIALFLTAFACINIFIFYLGYPHSTFKNFVLVSAPGSGKGTFSQYMVKKYGYVQICPGDIFRDEISRETELGKKIKPLVDSGEYVDESIVCDLIEKNVRSAIERNKPFIIDGFPRTTESLDFLTSLLRDLELEKSICLLQFVVDDEVCLSRILNRRICKNCFWVCTKPLSSGSDDGLCPNCGCCVSSRKADSEEIARKRLDYFHTHIEPLITHSKNNFLVKTIDTNRPVVELETEYERFFDL